MITSLHDPEIGVIHFKVHAQSRRIIIRMLSDGIQVTLPDVSFYDHALQLIEKHRVTIVEKKHAGVHRPLSVIDESHPLKTFTFQVSVVESDRSNLFFQLRNGFLKVDYPKHLSINDMTLQKKIKAGIVYFMRQEAKRILPVKTQEWSSKTGLAFKSLKIQSSTSRWGSCSSTNSINLSLFLMLLPEPLIDYVIVHELCHTVEHNHSARFWALVGAMLPHYKELRQDLKKYPLSMWAKAY
ncbi:MAG: M48 family metallopeptidase [Microbacter sp.]